ncbi:hypothetical protein LSAT2_009725 [Lamellibrachia satsuma]|nr:hypothetical protein LSAT2_009725 [Lamellibrachia satsuma]
MIEVIKQNGEQPNTTLQQLYGQKKNAVMRTKREIEEELYRKLDDDSGPLLNVGRKRETQIQTVSAGKTMEQTVAL